MRKTLTIFSRLTGKMFFQYFLLLFVAGCATLKPTPYELLEHERLKDIKIDLYGMTDEDIKTYFNYCINNEKIFIYTGGYANALLLDKKEFDFVWEFKTVSLGCTGGVAEGAKFNELMLNYIKQNISLAIKLSDVWAGMSKEDLKRHGYKDYLKKGFSPDKNEEWITFKRYWTTNPKARVTFYLTNDKVTRWEKSE